MKPKPSRVCFAVICLFFLASTSFVVASPATPKIRLEPKETLDVQPNQSFNVNVALADVSELYGWQFNLTFNPAVLNVVNVTEGPLLKQGGTTLFAKKTNNTRGYLLVSASFMPPYPAHGVNGSGVLGSIVFQVISQGSSTLHFEETSTKLRTVTAGNLVPIGFEVEHGSFRNVAPGFSLPLELIAGAIVIVAVGGVGGFVFFRRRRKERMEEEEEDEEERKEAEAETSKKT